LLDHDRAKLIRLEGLLCGWVMRVILVFGLVSSVFVGNIVFNTDGKAWGLPIFFLWNVFSVFLISAGMLLIYLLDPKNGGRK